ncbi:MAG: hypothetical protein J5I93_10540 [Pirellulaceae bacterium]|nr:hypothetical protein [Pirellulaceae bacterium]
MDHFHQGRIPLRATSLERLRVLREPRTGSPAVPTVGDAPALAATAATSVPRTAELMLVASWLVIGLVAAYDTYLSVKFQDSLSTLEINPICRWLIAADGGSVSILLGCKFAGTVLALGTILLVYRFQPRMGLAVATVVASLQMLVLLYLCLA